MIANKLLILLIIFFTYGIRAQENIMQKDISNKIEDLINKVDPNLNIGIKITNLTQQVVIYEKNAGRYFIPASTLKFITILTALEYFDEDYNFTSNLFYKNQDYYIDIHDPDFNLEDLTYFISELKQHSGGIIQGNIYIINNRFSLPPLMPDKTLLDAQYCYGAPITMVHINKNCSKLNVAPSEVGKNITINSDINFPYIIVNEAKTVDKDQIDRLHVTIEDEKYIIRGTLSLLTGAVTIGAVANDNLAHIKYNVQKQLDNSGITLKGKILFIDKEIDDGTLLAARSKNIKDIASKAMKKSDNFMSDYLLAQFATSNQIVEYDWAADKLKEIIKDRFDTDIMASDIRDGSGISRQNLLTVNQFDSFLTAIAKQDNFELIKSILATPDSKSTLQERFENVKIYAKTGSLTGVSTLVGYFYDDKRRLYSFVIMANNFYKDRSYYRKLQEDIVRLIIKHC